MFLLILWWPYLRTALNASPAVMAYVAMHEFGGHLGIRPLKVTR